MTKIEVLYTIAVAAIAIAGFLQTTRHLVGREGVERTVYLRATSVAFAATMFASLAYAVLEAIADAPALAMWWVWNFGIVAWLLATVTLTRRYG